MNYLAWILVLLAALLSIVGCAGKNEKHVYKNNGPLKNYGQTF